MPGVQPESCSLQDFQESACVAFIAHALLPAYRSSALINARLRELGRPELSFGAPQGDLRAIRWLQFQVVAATGGDLSVKVRVDFHIIPVFAPDFFGSILSGAAYRWVESVALQACLAAGSDRMPVVIGWGAGTKNATRHGRDFLDSHAAFQDMIRSTHGDAGTASLVIETLRRADLQPGFTVAIIGANGAIGDVVSRALPDLHPGKIVLIGKSDRPKETKNLDRLEELRTRVLESGGHGCEVVVHQDKARACLDHDVDVVIVATTSDVMTLHPNEVEPGTLVLDLCTPAACKDHPDWTSRLVLTSGCGELPARMLPQGFGFIDGVRVLDCGAGGARVLWGCTIETIVRALLRWPGHLAGATIPLEELERCSFAFRELGITPQPPASFGRLREWRDVRDFIAARTSRMR